MDVIDRVPTLDHRIVHGGERNRAIVLDDDLSAPDAVTRTVVVSSREDLEIARQVRSMLAPNQ